MNRSGFTSSSATVAATVLVLAVFALATPLASAQGFICAEGGGSLGRAEWASPVFAWMIEKGMHGNVAVLGAPVVRDEAPDAGSATAPAAAPDRLLERFKTAGAAGVVDLRIGPDNADTQETYDAIVGATIVFMRGGDQGKYVRAWKGTKTEAAIREVFKRGGVVGGTSAGCAVLGEVIYDAFHGSATSRDTLRDARNPDLTLTTGFLELTPGVIFDTHFTERARLGRFAVMLAMTRTDLKRDVIGIGMDTRTAFCVSPDGTAEVLGQGSATVLMLTEKSRIVLDAGKPPVVTEVTYTQLLPGARYDVRKRSVIECGQAEPQDPLSPEARRRIALLRFYDDLVIDGADPAHSRFGEAVVQDGGDPEALWNGRLAPADGEHRLGFCAVQTAAFDQKEFLENRVGGLQWLLAQKPGWLGIYATQGALVRTSRSAMLCVEAADLGPDRPNSSVMLLDTSAANCRRAGTSPVSDRATGPRQAAGMVGAALHVLAPGWGYDAQSPQVREPRNPTEQSK